MEPCRNTGAISQNCFLRTGADQRASSAVDNDIYLYDEAESLMYVCSETSMPPKSAGALPTADISATGRASSNGSTTSCRKSRRSSTMVYESAECQATRKVLSPRSAEGGVLPTDVISDFKSEILSKFKKFTITPNSSYSNIEECPKSHGVRNTREDTNSRSQENKIENTSQAIEELFARKTKFFASSSESERVRISSEDLQDEEFSTGMSDMDEGVKVTANTKKKSEERADSSTENIEIGGQRFATKSIVNHVHTTTERPLAAASPNRMGPPVQGRLSLRTMKTTPPCFCLLDEIRKNNLVMKEDLFSSSSPRMGELHTPHTQKAGRSSSSNNGNSKDRVSRLPKSTDMEITNKSPIKQQTSIRSSVGKTNMGRQHQHSNSDAAEVYEATGGKENHADAKDKRKQGPSHQDQAISDVNALATNIPYIRSQFDELWRPFIPPSQNECSKSSNERVEAKKKITRDPEVNIVSQKAEDPKQSPASSNTRNNDVQTLGKNDLTSERHCNNQMNDYLEAKTSTPNRRPEKYVKLPGLAEAFVQRDSNFRDLRIKDGTSFESVNALEEMSMRNLANQILEMKNTKDYKDMSMRKIAETFLELKKAHMPRMEEQVITQRKPETKDAATDVTIPLTNTKTQTCDLDKIMVDCVVQCESHIVDEANGRNVVENEHKEIMVCNDNGDGVQLYNELGHPLTDMDGYLLKDSLGRFLVRLDQYGVPISCTNGQGIYMEDSTAWGAVKNTVSIIHQSRKKPIKRDHNVKRSARPSLRQLENAMKNLKNTLEWADKISLDSSHENSLGRFTDLDKGKRSPRRSMKPGMDAAKLNNNTTSLIAEMKSIARLRNALLEKVNFIVDNKNKFGKFDKNSKFSRKTKMTKNPQESYDWSSQPTSIWEGHERPFSPTYQAIKKLKEANSWMNLDGNGPAHDLPIPSRSDGYHKNIRADLWMNAIGSKSFLSDFPNKENSVGNQPQIEINAISGSSINADFPTTMKSGGTEVNKTDLWNSFIDKSTDSFNASKIDTNSADEFPISQTNGYQGLDQDQELSSMRLSSEDNGNRTVVENVNFKNSSFTGRQLLISLENEYNLGLDNSWIEPWKNGKSPLNGIPERTEHPRVWSKMIPSIEFSSSSSNNF